MLEMNQDHAKATFFFSFYHSSHLTFPHRSPPRYTKQEDTLDAETHERRRIPPGRALSHASPRRPRRLILEARTETRDWQVAGSASEGTFTPLLASPRRLLCSHQLGEFFHCPIHWLPLAGHPTGAQFQLWQQSLLAFVVSVMEQMC